MALGTGVQRRAARARHQGSTLRRSPRPADTRADMAAQAGLWAATLGVTGFLCGFIGPMVLNPWANQGPMAGIFITGPGGALLGALLGALVAAAGVRPDPARRLRLGTTAAGALAVLYVALPAPGYESTVLDLDVRGCAPALSWRDRAFDDWQERLAATTWADPPPDWQPAFERAAAAGSIVSGEVVRRREVLSGRAPWNRGTRLVDEWTTTRSRRMLRRNDFYVAGGCDGFAPGTRGIYLAREADREDETFPPADPSLFLHMVRLESLPADLAPFGR
jgi:hypothetical protein